jgi:general stress protein YciG
MAGTKVGGIKAAQKNKEKYGKEFYAQIGAKGGKAKTAKGFATNRDLARAAGRKGGKAKKATA